MDRRPVRENGLTIPSAHPALAALDEQVEARYQEQEERSKALRVQRQLMRAQARFSQEGRPVDHAAAYAVQHFAAQARVGHEPGTGSVRPLVGRGDNQRPPGAAAAGFGSQAMGNSRSSKATPSPSHAASREIHQKCEVLYCNVEFDSLGRYVAHTEAHNHSPCNPTRHLINGKLENGAPYWCCTTCGNLYKTEETCLTHMEEAQHDHLQEPVSVPGFMCLTCFMVFPNANDCRMHQHKENHWSYGFPLPDDSGRPEPQLLPTPVMKAFRKACNAVRSKVECLQCGLVLPDSATTQAHLQRDHQVMATTDKILAEVWGTLMCGYTCVQCQRLYKDLPPDGLGALHQCSPTMFGMIVENDVKSTFDFILRRSLSHIPLVSGDEEQSTEEDVCLEGAVGGINEIGDDSIVLLDDSISDLALTSPKESERHGPRAAEASSSTDTTEGWVYVQRSDSIEVVGSVPADLNRRAEVDPPRSASLSSSGSGQGSATSSPSAKRKRDRTLQQAPADNNPKKRRAQPLDVSPNTSQGSAESRSCTSESSPEVEERGRSTLGRDVPRPGVCAERDDIHKVCVSSRRNKVAGRRDKKKTLGRHVDYAVPGPSTRVQQPQQQHQQQQRHPSPQEQHQRQQQQPPNATRQQVRELRQQSQQQQSPLLQIPQQQQQPQQISPQQNAAPSHIQRPPILQNLHTMRHIIFVDLDNWMGFWKKLMQPLPNKVFVWGFYGGKGNWTKPINCPAYEKAVSRSCFFLNDKCGTRKDAADFAICMEVGRQDNGLPPSIPFTILSGDKGFEEIERQMQTSTRIVRHINPHHKEGVEVYTLLMSMIEI